MNTEIATETEPKALQTENGDLDAVTPEPEVDLGLNELYELWDALD